MISAVKLRVNQLSKGGMQENSILLTQVEKLEREARDRERLHQDTINQKNSMESSVRNLTTRIK